MMTDSLQSKAADSTLEMPLFGFGTWRLKGKECTELVAAAIDVGYRHIDTAELYGNQPEVARGIGSFPREQLYITSKVPYQSLEPQAIVATCEKALRELNTDYLDLFLVHWPSDTMCLRSVLETLANLIAQNKVRQIGVSNFSTPLLRKTIEKSPVPISNIQIECHLHLPQERLRAECKKHGISVTAYAPLGRANIFETPEIKEIASRHSCTPAQLALAWLLFHGVAVIPKTASAPRLIENYKAQDVALSEEDVARLDGIGIQQRFVKADWLDNALCFDEFAL